MTLSGAATLGRTWSGSDGNEGVPAFPKALVLLETHQQIVKYHIQDTRWGSLTPLQIYSQCILQPQPTKIKHVQSIVIKTKI